MCRKPHALWLRESSIGSVTEGAASVVSSATFDALRKILKWGTSDLQTAELGEYSRSNCGKESGRESAQSM